MERKRTDGHRMVRTPKYGIPIGEVVRKENGSFCVRIKKAHAKVIEEVPFSQFLMLFRDNPETR